MEVLKILQNDADSLTNDDLDFLIEELDTGDYFDGYISMCKSIIEQVKSARSFNAKKNNETNVFFDVLRTEREIKSGTAKEITQLSEKEQLFRKISIARPLKYSGQIVLEAINNNIITLEEAMEDTTYINGVEKDVIINNLQVSEELLEKCFNELNKSIISSKQVISETFFIRHFNDLDLDELKKNTLIDWINNPNSRSEKLNMFLKLKGIKL